MSSRWLSTIRKLQHRGGTRRGGAEAGNTLTEIAISLVLLSLLFSTVPIVMQTLSGSQAYVNNTYLNLDQLLPVSTSFQQLIRSVVAPGPTQSGSNPVPAFGTYNSSGKIICSQSASCNTSYSPTGAYQASPIVSGLSSTSATFFSNVGDPNGPAMVVANLNTTCTTATSCQGVFTVTIAHANASPPCPFSSTDYTDHCTWGTPHQLITVDHVVNACSTSTNCPQPLFTYTLQGFAADPSICAQTPSTPGCVQQPQGPGSPNFASCTTTSCSANQILDVGIDLKVNSSATASQADEQTVVYELSENSAAYDPEVG
jgi:hypothetical protein